MANEKLLSINYLKHFQCLGSECEDNCCSGWDVHVDHDTLERMHECPDAELRAYFEEHLQLEAPHTSCPARAARFTLTADRRCGFLGEDKLCQLQQRAGPEYLPCLCSRYPREENIVDGVRERNATLGCPETARLALLGQGALTFEEEGVEDRWPQMMHREQDSAGASGAKAYRAHFSMVRALVLQIMQNSKRPIETRIFRLGELCHTLHDLIEQSRFGDIPARLQAIARRRVSWFAQRKKAVADEVVAHTLQCLCGFELMELPLPLRYHKSLAQVRRAFSDIVTLTPVEIVSTLERAEHKYARTFLRRYPRFYENYLVNLILKQLFPFDEQRPVWEQFQELAVHYVLGRIQLIASAMSDGDFQPQGAIGAISSLTRTWGANSEFRKILGQAGLVKAEFYAGQGVPCAFIST